MNIDDLKGAWKNDDMKGAELPANTTFCKKSASPLAQIRRNMKNEFMGVLISYGFLIAYLFYGMKSALFFNITSIFVFIILVLNCIYFFRFYVFYKSINHYDFSIKKSISKLAYELELNTEIYKTYNLCVTPLAVLVTFTLLCGNNGLKFIGHIFAADIYTSPWNVLIAFVAILISFGVTYVCINHHIRTQYGKYITELKQMMDDLENE
ncbi:hypothetical protein [Mucilaginibacter gotjawali]|uniref:Uncharacterized protein n=2 Tax=Mucilaginibacter gotjawali TaxID=1550579 RepID=A0A839SMJ9_9SPHI|nr:hypothetical protein [Mucilaginibacter gotjawali]MBB3058464.1 hypothetical protein [Mucilaginibacter gotjawali]BAU53707.1 hypothetical protein MgSA37_01876 [Mucilaginibacter gotjawali]